MKNLPARKTWACGADILWSGFVGYFCCKSFSSDWVFRLFFCFFCAGLTNVHSSNALGLSINPLMEIDKLEQNEEAKTATKIVNVVSVASIKQAAVLARQLQMKIYSEFWRDFGDQRSTDQPFSVT